MLKMFSALYRYVKSGIADAVDRGITDGASEGAERALARLTSGEVTADLLTSSEPAPVELIEPVVELPPLTRTQVHGMNRDELTALVNGRGLDVDLGGTVKEIRESVFEVVGI